MIDMTDTSYDDKRLVNLFAVICDRCGEKRYCPRWRAMQDTYCFRCACSEKSRVWHLANPSGPEKKMIRILDKMKVPYEREAPFFQYNLDFVLRGTHVVEVTGGRLHRDLYCPEKEERRTALIQQHYKLLMITDGNVRYAKDIIKEFLNA